MTVASVLSDGLRLPARALSAPNTARSTPHGRIAGAPRNQFAGALEDAALLILLAYSLPFAMLAMGAPVALFFVFLSRLLHQIATRL